MRAILVHNRKEYLQKRNSQNGYDMVIWVSPIFSLFAVRVYPVSEEAEHVILALGRDGGWDKAQLYPSKRFTFDLTEPEMIEFLKEHIKGIEIVNGDDEILPGT